MVFAWGNLLICFPDPWWPLPDQLYKPSSIAGSSQQPAGGFYFPTVRMEIQSTAYFIATLPFHNFVIYFYLGKEELNNWKRKAKEGNPQAPQLCKHAYHLYLTSISLPHTPFLFLFLCPLLIW